MTASQTETAQTEIDGAAESRGFGPKGFGRYLRAFGPGLITGASDDDPSGIATYSQAGARFGLSHGVIVGLVNALAAAPFLVIVMVIASDHSIMGEYKNGWLARVLGWVTVSVMAAGAIALIALS